MGPVIIKKLETSAGRCLKTCLRHRLHSGIITQKARLRTRSLCPPGLMGGNACKELPVLCLLSSPAAEAYSIRNQGGTMSAGTASSPSLCLPALHWEHVVQVIGCSLGNTFRSASSMTFLHSACLWVGLKPESFVIHIWKIIYLFYFVLRDPRFWGLCFFCESDTLGINLHCLKGHVIVLGLWQRPQASKKSRILMSVSHHVFLCDLP